MPSKEDPQYEQKMRDREKVMKQNRKTRNRERLWEGFKQMKEEAGGDAEKLKEMKRDARKKKEEKRHIRGRRGPEEPPHEMTAADDQGNAGSDDVNALSQSFKSFSINQENAGNDLQV